MFHVAAEKRKAGRGEGCGGVMGKGRGNTGLGKMRTDTHRHTDTQIHTDTDTHAQTQTHAPSLPQDSTWLTCGSRRGGDDGGEENVHAAAVTARQSALGQRIAFNLNGHRHMRVSCVVCRAPWGGKKRKKNGVWSF